MTFFRSRASLLPLVLLLTACPFGPSDDEVDPAAADALDGVWQHVVPGEVESTVSFLADGSFTVVEANLLDRRCETLAGTWDAGAGVLVITVTRRDERVVSESESISYQISGGSASFLYADGDSETWSRIGTMPSCSDYGWWTATMSAVVDGAALDFQVHIDEARVEQDIAAGSFFFGGWAEVPWGEATDCSTCKVLELELLHQVGGAIVAGTYTMSGSSSDTLWASATYRPSYPGTDVHYRTDEYFDDPGATTGSIELTSVGPTLIEGTFSFTAYDGRAQPPYPTVSVTEGHFTFRKQ